MFAFKFFALKLIINTFQIPAHAMLTPVWRPEIAVQMLMYLHITHLRHHRCVLHSSKADPRTRFPFFVYDQCPEEFQNKDIRDLCSTPIDGDNSKPGKGGVHFSSHQADEK